MVEKHGGHRSRQRGRILDRGEKRDGGKQEGDRMNKLIFRARRIWPESFVLFWYLLYADIQRNEQGRLPRQFGISHRTFTERPCPKRRNENSNH